MASGEVSGPGTTVGVNVALSGTLKDQNDIVIFGMVEGEVISEKAVTVGKTAQIKGPIRGKIVTIAGLVRGEIEAEEKLELVDTGKVYGSISTKDLVIHSGATFIGKSIMAGKEGVIDEEVEAFMEKEGIEKPKKEEKKVEEPVVEPQKEEQPESALLPTPDEE